MLSSGTIQAGNILFYRVTPGNLIELLIQKFERKQNAFIHCAIAISTDEKVEALPEGIIQSRITRTPDGIFHYQQSATPLFLPDALEWLKKQVGQAYGFIDIADAVLAMYERAIFLQDTWYDCSALATEFLIKAGGINLGSLTESVHAVSPQELADQLKVK